MQIFYPILWVVFSLSSYCPFLLLFIYFWLHQVLVAAHGIFIETCGIFCCGTQASLQLWRAGFLSLVQAHKLSSCGARAQLSSGMWDASSLTRDQTYVLCIGRWILHHWTTREVPFILSFDLQKFLVLIKSTLSIFSFVACALDAILKKTVA